MSNLLPLGALALALLPFSSPAPCAAAGEHVTVTARCEPAMVQAGGFVDLVLEYQLDPGWHAVSPRSKNGPRVQIELAPAPGVARYGTLRGFGGEPKDDAAFGPVVQITGKGELRQHLRVADDATGKPTVSGATVWVVCDAKSCLPPQKLPFSASFTVDSHGARGPGVVEPPPGFATTPEEKSACTANGFVARATPELASAAPGAELFVALDLRLEPGVSEDSLNIEVADLNESDHGGLMFTAAGWRAAMGPADAAKGDLAQTMREILPLMVDPAAKGASVDLPLTITMRLKKRDGTLSLATQELRVVVPVER